MTAKVQMTEVQWSRQVREIATLYGWELMYHTHRSDRSDPGFPDEVLCRPPRVLFVELKTQTGRIRPAQRAWMDGLTACGLEVALWRPADRDEVIRVLRKDGCRPGPLPWAADA